jgi:hypothetical protein
MTNDAALAVKSAKSGQRSIRASVTASGSVYLSVRDVVLGVSRSKSKAPALPLSPRK